MIEGPTGSEAAAAGAAGRPGLVLAKRDGQQPRNDPEQRGLPEVVGPLADHFGSRLLVGFPANYFVSEATTI